MSNCAGAGAGAGICHPLMFALRPRYDMGPSGPHGCLFRLSDWIAEWHGHRRRE